MTTVTIPDTPEGLQEVLSDRAKRTTLFADDKAFPEFLTKYVKAFGVKDKGTTTAELDEKIQLGVANFLRDHGVDGKPPVDLRPGQVDWAALNTEHRKGALYNEVAPGARLEGEYGPTRRDFWQTVSFKQPRDKAQAEKWAQRRAKVTEIRNSFGSEVPADGGFLIPETMRSEILSIALEKAVVRQHATVIPMESLRVPIPTIDDTTHASSVFGGIVGYWTEEAAALTESQATFGRVVLEAKKLTGYAEFPNELLADASALGGFFNQRFPEAIAYFEDVAFILGTGNGQPLGFVNNPAAVVATAESGQGATTLVWENLLEMYRRMLPTSLMNAVWVANINTFRQLATMALSVGTGGSAVWIGQGLNQPGSAGPPTTILGRPVYFTEKCPGLGTTGDINFVDLSYYMIGDRQSVSIDTSEHYKFANDKTAMRIIERVDGRPWIQSAITPRQGTDTLSPFVQLSSTRT